MTEAWQPVARLLADRGYPVLALTLPGLSYDGSAAGLGLADAIDVVNARSSDGISRTTAVRSG